MCNFLKSTNNYETDGVYIIVNSTTQNHINKLRCVRQISMTTNHNISNNNKSRSNLTPKCKSKAQLSQRTTR